jgi:hypothetical protein
LQWCALAHPLPQYPFIPKASMRFYRLPDKGAFFLMTISLVIKLCKESYWQNYIS